jgi:hypothetical protein
MPYAEHTSRMSRKRRNTSRNRWPKAKREGELQAETPPMHFITPEKEDDTEPLGVHRERLPPDLATKSAESEEGEVPHPPRKGVIFVAPV